MLTHHNVYAWAGWMYDLLSIRERYLFADADYAYYYLDLLNADECCMCELE